jgi:hypothetical protein
MNIVSKRDSGLGDMLSNLTHCIWLAKNIGANVLADWRYTQYHDSKNQKINFFPEFFELNADFYIPELANLNIGQVVLPYGLKLLSQRNDRTAVEPQVFETFGLTGRVPRFDTFVTTRSLDFLPIHVQYEYLNLIQIKRDIQNECDRYLESIRQKDRKIYAVHIRHGNGELYIPGGEAEQLLFQLYKNAVEKILEKEGSADFFIFTDSQVAVNWFENTFGTVFKNMNVRYPKRVGLPMHENRDSTIFGYDILKWAVQDMYYMSKLDGLICDSWSSYTRLPRAHARESIDKHITIINPPRRSIAVSKPVVI